MAKGAAIRFQSYAETVPKLLNILGLAKELKKHNQVVLKPALQNPESESTSSEFTEAVLKFVLENKNPITEVFIAEGSDGVDTDEMFDSHGYKELAEKYDVGLVDLNNTGLDEIYKHDFQEFERIDYPSILASSFVISLPVLSQNEELEIQGALSNMLGAFPASVYRGFFTKAKTKIRKSNIKYSIHDILKCKLPDFAVMDASSHGFILSGLPLEIDTQACKLLKIEKSSVPYLKLIEESFSEPLTEEQKTAVQQI